MDDEAKGEARWSRWSAGGIALLAFGLLNGSSWARRDAGARTLPCARPAGRRRPSLRGGRTAPFLPGLRVPRSLGRAHRGGSPRSRHLVGRPRGREEGRRQADGVPQARREGRTRVEVPLDRQGPDPRAPGEPPGHVRGPTRPGPDQRVAPRQRPGGRLPHRGRGDPPREAPHRAAAGRRAPRGVPRGVRGHAGDARGGPLREAAGHAGLRGLHPARRHRRARRAPGRGFRRARGLPGLPAGAPPRPPDRRFRPAPQAMGLGQGRADRPLRGRAQRSRPRLRPLRRPAPSLREVEGAPAGGVRGGVPGGRLPPLAVAVPRPPLPGRPRVAGLAADRRGASGSPPRRRDRRGGEPAAPTLLSPERTRPCRTPEGAARWARGHGPALLRAPRPRGRGARDRRARLRAAPAPGRRLGRGRARRVQRVPTSGGGSSPPRPRRSASS